MYSKLAQVKKNYSGEYYKICKKIYDSLLLYCVFFSKDILYTKDNLKFILVYNYDKIVKNFGYGKKGVIDRCIIHCKNEFKERFSNYFKYLDIVDCKEFVKDCYNNKDLGNL